jgi:hypothetical protein
LCFSLAKKTSSVTVPAHKGPTAGVGGARLTRFLVEACQSHLVFRIATGFCCAVFVLLTASGKLNQAASIDPYIYAGYTHNYAALLERFGPTYYSERIAYIFPAWAFAYLFGLEGGYFAFRIVALASAVTAVFAIGMRFYGFAPAILAAVWLTFTPWLPRSLLWTYPDGIAVVYLLVGMAFLLVPNSRRLICHVVAGATFMFAITCNLSLLAIGGLLAPSWAFFYRRQGMVWLARAILAVAFGFFATYVALALILYVKFPAYGFSFEFATIREAISLLNGRGQTWYKPLATIIWQEKDFTLLIPITFALAALLLVVRRSAILGSAKRDREFAVLAATYLTSIVGFSLILHFGLHDASLSLPWYTVYFVPGCVVALIALAGEAERRGGPIFGTVAVYCGAGLILIWWVAYPILPHLESSSSFYSWLVVAGATAAAAAAVALRRAIASAVLVAGVVLLSMSLYQYGFYQIRTVSSAEQATEWDVYRGAVFLQQFVNANVRPNQSVGFWYTGDMGSSLNSVQSVYLWDYTRVFPPQSPGMPLVDAQFRDRVANGMIPLMHPVTSLILLGVSDAETDSGLTALRASGLDLHEIQVKRAHFQGHSWGYTAVLVEMNRPNMTVGPLVADVPLASLDADHAVSLSIDGFKPINGASVLLHADGLLVTTASPQWSYSLVGQLRSSLQVVHQPVVVRMLLRVEEGAIGIGVSSRDNVSNLIRREDGIEAGADLREVCLYVSDPSAADLLIIQNESNKGPSRTELHSADVFLPRLREYPEAASGSFNCEHYRS